MDENEFDIYDDLDDFGDDVKQHKHQEEVKYICIDFIVELIFMTTNTHIAVHYFILIN